LFRKLEARVWEHKIIKENIRIINTLRKMERAKTEIILFDVDGTLTPPRLVRFTKREVMK